MNIENKEKSNIILTYYKLVDNNKIDKYIELLELYSDDIVYDRAWVVYNWRKELRKFFENRFNILDIKHNILNIEFFENWDIFVEWTFDWEKEWKDIFWNFIDRFRINNNKIIFRKTYLIVDKENSWIIQINKKTINH